MSEFTIIEYVNTLKPAMESQSSQCKLFNLLFKPYLIKAKGEKGRMLPKAVSNIMNRKQGIPQYLKNIIINTKISEVENYFDEEVYPIINGDLIDSLKIKFTDIIKSDMSIPCERQNELLGTISSDTYGSKTAKVLAELFVYAVGVPFEKPTKTVIIHYISSAVNSSNESDVLSDFKEQYGAYINLDKSKTVKQLDNNKIYKLTTECSLESSIVRNSFFTKVGFTYNNKKYEAQTSCDNWLSESFMNNQLSVGKAEFSLIFKLLNTDNENGTAHIYIIGEI